MTQVFRNSRTSLPTINSYDKYFYVSNNNYSTYSNTIYICLEDNNFGLNYNSIKYCRSNIDHYKYPDDAIKGCFFHFNTLLL